MIKFIFKNDIRKFKKNEEIVIDKPNTLLVGDNGCGKSTLLQLLWLHLEKEPNEKYMHPDGRFEYKGISKLKDDVIIETDYQRVYICDSILRLREANTHMQCAVNNFIDFKLSLNIDRYSHGQITKLMYINTTDAIIDRREKECFEGGKALLLLDEVEVGMSVQSQFKLPNSLLAVSNDGQFDILTSTHSIPIILDDRYNVFDVDNRKYVNGNEYVNLLKQPQKERNRQRV